MSSDSLQPGAVVADQYRIERLIGSGGFARVYRAEEVDLGRTVALKVLSPKIEGQLSTAEAVRKRFYREARLISRFQDPRTVTMYEYDVLDDGRLYMALEYIDGLNLGELLQREGALDPERITHLIAQVLLGLREAHAHDVLHRDIKPSNIMIYDRYGEPDCVKLLDFGIAKAVMTEHKAGQELTSEGGVIGTPSYMSPEQLLGKPLTPASDLFGVGIVMYEMFDGRSPYESRDRTQIYRRMQRFDEDLGALSDAPEPLARLGRGLLNPEPEERYQSAEEVLEILLGRKETTGPNDTEAHAAISPSAVRTTRAPATAASGGSHGVMSARPVLATTFPLGLDPSGATESTELTIADYVEEPTVILPQHRSPAPQPTAETPDDPTARDRKPEIEVPTAEDEERRWQMRRYRFLMPIMLGFAALMLALLVLTDDDPERPASETQSESPAGAQPGETPKVGADLTEVVGTASMQLDSAIAAGTKRATAVSKENVTASGERDEEEAETERPREKPREKTRRPAPRRPRPSRKTRKKTSDDSDPSDDFEIEAFE